jgi:beta-lactamase regulating signal transducer with metallopeptidase domain
MCQTALVERVERIFEIPLRSPSRRLAIVLVLLAAVVGLLIAAFLWLRS